MNISHPVNRALIRRRMTQIELAKRIRRAPCTISGVINKLRVSKPLQLLIADELGMSVKEAFPEDAA